jgi:subtilisin-like proprotein convertase family protein
MRSRFSFWILLGLLLLAGAWLFWPAGNRRAAHKPAAPPVRPYLVTTRSGSTAPLLLGVKNSPTNSVVKTNPFAWRLSNTKKSIGQLENDPHAILLANALLDTRNPLNFSIPKNLRASGDPGAYIVQASGPIDAAFRARLAAAGAQIVSYIPNNAYLVTAPAGGVAGLSGQPGVQSVLAYEPYYKISESLLGAAVEQKSLPDNTLLTLGLFANNAQPTVDQIKQLGATVVATDQSPFGPIVRVVPPANWTALADLPGVQIVEVAHRRALANDLARVTLGISADTVTLTNYLNLNGSNVLVEVNDSGIDQTHPDFSIGKNAASPSPAAIAPGSGRVFGDSSLSLVDTNGHGTHVAGIIAGNGWASYTVTAANPPQGSVTNADFRGKAPAADLYSVAFLDASGNSLAVPDYYLQSVPAQTNALISNNSWNYTGDNSYDLAAASYDAAVRDALPLVTGSQPVLFVFAAGNDGSGNDGGGGGDSDTILSPATGKNVITVGALEQLRNITNYVGDGQGNTNQVWQPQTDTSFQIAGYSSRGNVGIGTEGAFGRFKPDVAAPGSFVVSTRSSEWDQDSYYNPTNYTYNEYVDQTADPNNLNYYNFSVPENAVGLTIQIVPNANSPTPFPNLAIYVSQNDYPIVGDPSTYDFVTTNDEVSIPPDGGGGYLTLIQGNGFNYAIGGNTNSSVSYDIVTTITTTNDYGDYYTVLSNLNETLAPWYRYESGTSMATPAVSGTLALIQDYFTNTLHATPSPALLKAMLINGARAVGNYNLVVTNAINYQGWGLPSLPDSLPPGLTNKTGVACSTVFVDQSPTNALATGDSQSFLVTTNDPNAQSYSLRVTLAWTDPPGNPAAAIKLVNNLDLMVSNNVTGAVYFGNDIPSGSTFNEVWDTNTAPNLDAINNVENIFLPSAGSYTVTVIGRSVNVNAVTAQTNNVVQDYALVISCGEGEVTNAITVTANPLASNPTTDQQVNFIGVDNNGMATNGGALGGVFLNQLAGANTPLLGTNTVGAGPNYNAGAVITLGMTNQWHFYVVQNTTGFTNAAFVTFEPDTLATPRMGVFADSDANSTQPEADIDLYVATEPGLTNLNPNVISNCVNGVYGDGASLSRGGTEFVAYDNSTAGQVYYVAVKSETADAAEYGFLPVFSQQPFSTMQNGIETVNGLVLPVSIPDGSPAHPGTAYIFALAIQPIEVQDVIVGDQITHQNFGDLIGTLNHGEKTVVLNNHDSLFNSLGIYNFTYDDGPAPVVGSQPPDGPGSLQTFQGQQGIGPWIFTEVDDALTHTGAVTGLTITITPHLDLRFPGINVAIPGGGYFYGYIDVPVGTTNLTLSATNISGTPLDPNHYTLDTLDPGMLFEKLGEQPEPPPTPPTNYDKTVTLNNGTPPGGTISIGPSDIPRIQPGRYFVTLYNPSATPQQYFIIATLGIGQVQAVDFNGGGSVPLLDDAVTYSYLTNYPTANSTNETIATIAVGIRVDHPRISDLVFHLISPDGTRYLLMENRGGTSTNGAGGTIITTNRVRQTNYTYLVFTEDTNLTTTPIKFAAPPFGTGGSAASANLVANGSFETPVVPQGGPYPGLMQNMTTGLTGWIVASGNVDLLGLKSPGNPYWQPAAGNQSIDLAGNTPGAIYQDIPTVAGQVYNLRFAHACNPDGKTNHTASVFWAGVNVTNAAFLFANTTVANMGWQYVTLPVTGTGGLNRLEFEDLNGETDSAGPTLDDVSLTSVIVPTNLYYLPEQSLDPLIGTSAYGVWTLEIQDDRVGATNNAVLDAWQLQVVFADTNPVPALLTNSLPVTNTVPANGIVWYQVNVPLNADIATNTLIFATLPVNLLVNPTAPSTNGATALLTGSTGGSANLTATTAPPLIPGSTYYLGVQNNNNVAVNFAVEVTFHLLGIPYAYTEPAQLVTGTSAQLNGMASPNGYAATAWFQWGTNTLYGNLTPPVAVGAGAGVFYTTNTIINLVTNVPYHFRLVVSNAQGVAYGFDQILDEANVVAWGPDYAGQLNVPTNLNNVVAIAGAYDHSLALNTNGLVVAWGDNTFGQATVPSGLNNVVAIAGGQYYSLALQSSGNVVSWGANLLTQTNVPAGLSNVVTIAGGTYSSLALQNNGAVVAWGANFFGLTTVPSGVSNIVAVAGGGYHSLALKNDGTVIVWGDDSAGQTNVPSNLNNVAAIAAGGYHSLALKYDGTVVAWGDDSVGQTNVPVGLSNVVAIAAGGFHSLALKADGTVVAWGDNTAGQTSVPVGLTNVVAISGGYLHSMALTPQSLINSTNVIVLTLVPGVPQTNGIFGGGITYYKVTVPTNADFATNILLFANNGPLNIWFSTNTPPVLNSADATQLGIGVTNGVWVLNTNNAPVLVPGSTYYLGVQNPNSFTVSYAVEVDFHLITASVTLPIDFYSIIHTNINGTNGYLLTWFAPSNDLFQVQWADGIPPVWNTFSNIISFNTNVFTGPLLTQFNFFDDGTQTGGFPDPTRFYNLILLGSFSNLTNGVPQTNSVPAGGTAYFAVNVPANADIATNNLLFASAPVSLLFNQATLPSGANSGGFTLLTNSIGGSTNLSAASAPPLVSGATYYLGVQNTNAFAVNFSLLVNFHSAASPATNTVYPISSVTYSNGDFLLTWLAPTNDLFTVQVATNLALPLGWQTIATNIAYTGPVTTTNGLFSYLDTNSTGTLRFYQVLLQGVPASVPPITGFAYTTNGFTLTWSAPASEQFQVKWTTNFVPPVTWTPFPGIITSTNGIFSFTDTNAPLLLKFYELMLLP